MPSFYSHDLLVNGIASAKAGEHAEARRLLLRALDLDLEQQDRIEALFWLSESTTNVTEQRGYLEEILAMDFSDGRARRNLALLDGLLKLDHVINPDIPQPLISTEPLSTDAKRFVCPNCGGKMVFSPDGQALVCEYCESKQKPQASLSSNLAEDQDFFIAMSTAKGHHKVMATRIYNCGGCGASFIFQPTQLSRICPHCGSAHVIKNDDSTEIICPTGIIPFQITEGQAKQLLKAWLSKKSLLEQVRVKHGSGVYIPVWDFDIGGPIPYRYRLYKDKKWVDIANESYILKRDILIPATQNMDQYWRQQLTQFDLSQVVEYNENYLSNWLAETYQIPLADASLDAREKAFSESRQNISAGLIGRIEDLVITSSKLRVDSYRLLLVPVWIVKYANKTQEYTVTINGYNGTVIGETPANGLRKFVEKIVGDR